MKFTVVVAALALLICAVSAKEFVTGYVSPQFFDGWDKQTFYLQRNNSDNSQWEVTNKTLDSFTTLSTIIVNNSRMDLGWDYVYIQGGANASSDDRDARAEAYRAAGYLEGFVTAERISQVYGVVAVVPRKGSCEDKWVNEHVRYIDTQISLNPNSTYWRKMDDLISLMEGISAGYSAAYPDDKKSFMDIFYLNFANELGDVAQHCGSTETLKAQMESQHCSALIKNVGDEIFFSHITWSGFNSMVRQFKTYAMETTVVMSGSAGSIASGDDWYMTSNELAVQETTNDYYNKTLAVDYVLPKTVAEFLRVMAANFIANNGSAWSEIFAAENSGTYCNQYMVLDTKLFTPGDKIMDDNLLWIAEQMPGNVTYGNQSRFLDNNGYWASYNIPFYKNIYDKSGFEEMKKKEGPFWSYTNYSRAEIFRRNESDVTDLTSMRAMMRFNEFETDPLSIIPNCANCAPKYSPMLSIASRGDLVSKTAVLPTGQYGEFFARNAFGAIDAKITSTKMIKSLQGTVICGPTHETQPVFEFNTTQWKAPPGAPNRFDFGWVDFIVPTEAPPGKNYFKSLYPTGAVVAGVVVAAVVIAGGLVFIIKVVLPKVAGKPDDSYTPIA